MITQDYIRQMARYNRWQNKSLIAAAKTLPLQAIEQDQGAFFGSTLNTFRHLMWGDQIWMSRFDNWEVPKNGIPDSTQFGGSFDEFCTKRTISDARILRWSEKLDPSLLQADLVWYSGALDREISKPLATCIVHFFNHQTHHRGQIHAMLTAAGAKPGDTDLFIMPEDI